jgi:hypothetical protein
MEWRDQYEAIAPTVFIGIDTEDSLAFARGVADAGGRLATWDRMHAAFEATLDRARTALPHVQGMSYAKIQAWDGAWKSMQVMARSPIFWKSWAWSVSRWPRRWQIAVSPGVRRSA